MTRKTTTTWIIGALLATQAGCGGSLFTRKSEPPPQEKSVKHTDMKDAPAAKINPATFFAAGQVHEREGHLLPAAQQYRRATQADPNYVMAYNRLGIVCDKLKMFAEADEAFNTAVRLSPASSFLWNNLAFSRMLQGDYLGAESALHKALSLNPAYVRARINLGVVLTRTRRNAEAVECFAKVLPRDVATYNVGVLCVADQRYDEARETFRRVLAINPDAADARQQLAKLRQLKNNPTDTLRAELASAAERIVGRLGPAAPPRTAATPPRAGTSAARPATQPAIAARATEITEPAGPAGAMEVEYVP